MERLFFREKIKRDYAPLEEGVMMDRQKYVVGAVIDGLAAGIVVDENLIREDHKRRAPSTRDRKSVV